MALKALMLRKRLDAKNKELEALRAKEAGFVTRETELETAIAEAETEEEQHAVEEEIEAFQAERDANNTAIKGLEQEVSTLGADLEAEERAQQIPAPAPEQPTPEMRGENYTMERKNKFGITREAIHNAAGGDDFISTIRAAITEKRALSNAGLLIPDYFLGLVRENVVNYSKLYRHTFLRQLGGEGKLTIMGTIPEAVWTACCGNINEIDLGFAEVTVDCNKVAAFVPVCNSVLDDNDVNLATQLVEALSVAVGKALDKAILYGSGSGMPMGVYTRLAQTSEPSTYPSTARTWVDLHTTNVLTIGNSVTGISLFQTIMLDSAVMSGKYSRGEIVWAMNELTYKYLKAQGMSTNAAGQIVSAVDGQMPAAGGVVEVLDFVPDYNIIGGYFDCYLLAERAAMQVENSNLVKLIEDETVFRVKARYDGQPVIAEAFCVLGVNGTTPSAVSLTSDTANTVAYILIDKSAVTLSSTTGTVTLKARCINTTGQEVDADITWTSSSTSYATVSSAGKVTGVATGSAVITATAGNAIAVCNVTIP